METVSFSKMIKYTFPTVLEVTMRDGNNNFLYNLRAFSNSVLEVTMRDGNFSVPF
jgi:hypothetical protein